jgi:hypothetical protein
MPPMPGTADLFASRVNKLRRDHNYVIVDWVGRRVIEGLKLDAWELKAGIEDCIDQSLSSSTQRS